MLEAPMKTHTILVAIVGILSGAALIFTGAINLKAASLNKDLRAASRQRYFSIPAILTGGLFVVLAVLVFTSVIRF
jgi:hypothetical protein